MDGIAAVSPDQSGISGPERFDRKRLEKLVEARELLSAALELLDIHARSPAAANVDLAIHQIDTELADH